MKNNKILFMIAAIMLSITLLGGCQKISDATITEVGSIMSENKSELFEMKIYSDKQVYKTSDEIKIWTTLEYTGEKNEITIWHGEPYIVYEISDGKDFNLKGVIEDILKSTVLKKGEISRLDYFKSGGFSEEDTKADFWKNFFKEKELYLPEGEYTIKAYTMFSLSQTYVGSEHKQEVKLKIKVEK